MGKHSCESYEIRKKICLSILKYSYETEIWFEISELSSLSGVKKNTGFASLYLGKLGISISVRVFHFVPGSFWESATC